MFAGHLGAGLLLKRAGRDVNLGGLFLSAMLLDVVLWILVLAGIEGVNAPQKFERMTELKFDFPYSHSLAAALGWSAAAFATAWFIRGANKDHRLAVSIVIAAAVFSHFVLDWLVHIPELPLASRNSPRLGLGLWQNLPLAWSIETALVVAGVWVYLKEQPLRRSRVAALIVVMILATALTIIGQASNSPPPSAVTVAGTSLVTIALLVAFGWWIERTTPSRAG